MNNTKMAPLRSQMHGSSKNLQLDTETFRILFEKAKEKGILLKHYLSMHHIEKFNPSQMV